MFDIEISRTGYLFSGPVYVSVYVALHVAADIWFEEQWRRFEDFKYKMVPGDCHDV